jgi:sarcosine oxidase
VALIGPDEPADRWTHQGVFASHYDEGRITRILDADRIWALLAQRSIARYREIEARSGIPFYHEVGHLTVGPEPVWLKKSADATLLNSCGFSVCSVECIRRRFQPQEPS